MPNITLAKPSIMTWNNNKISDHNRSDVQIDVTRIEEMNRMANGTMRKYVIADKRTFTTSWTDLPQTAVHAVDGFWAKREIETWYNNMSGPFTLALHYGDGVVDSYSVVLTKYSATISKRGAFDFWKVDIEMQEV